MKELERFLTSGVIEHPVLFAKVSGSRSYNLYTAQSDWDFAGVYVLPLETILGINSASETLDSMDGFKPDYSFHEVRKFCRLLIEGNPTALETLFTDRMSQWRFEWETLRNNRSRFITQRAVKSYLEYARGQLRKLERGLRLDTKGGDYNEKWAYHLLRLLQDCCSIALSGTFDPWKEGPDRDILMAVRYRDVSPEEVIAKANQEINYIETVMVSDSYTVPREPDTDWLNDWLVSLRKSFNPEEYLYLETQC